MRDRAKDHHRTEEILAPDLDVLPASVGEEAELVEQAPTSLKSAGDLKVGEAREEQLGDSPIIVRQKVHETVPMSVDEALNQLELVGHPFFLFVDEETMQPCVVYHRHGWTYGVLRLNATVIQTGE